RRRAADPRQPVDRPPSRAAPHAAAQDSDRRRRPRAQEHDAVAQTWRLELRPLMLRRSPEHRSSHGHRFVTHSLHGRREDRPRVERLRNVKLSTPSAVRLAFPITPLRLSGRHALAQAAQVDTATATATLSGTVVDQTGAAIADVEVIATNIATGLERS